MRISYLFVFTNFLFFNLLLVGQDYGEWKTVRGCDNNIKAYVQKVPYSQIKKVKVETVIETTLSELVALMKDSENHTNWVFLNEEASIIEETDELNWKYYGVTDTPWPVSNRDFITDITLRQDSVDYSVTLTSYALPDFLPEKEDCVRVPYIFSVWTFNPIGNGSVHVVLELEADVGGKIPIWLINLAVTKGPLNTMVGLIDELKTNRYKDVDINYIKEL